MRGLARQDFLEYTRNGKKKPYMMRVFSYLCSNAASHPVVCASLSRVWEPTSSFPSPVPHVGTTRMPRAMHSGLNPFSPSRVQSTYLMSFLPSGPNACVGASGYRGKCGGGYARACAGVCGWIHERICECENGCGCVCVRANNFPSPVPHVGTTIMPRAMH